MKTEAELKSEIVERYYAARREWQQVITEALKAIKP
jgi:hypothetical protein